MSWAAIGSPGSDLDHAAFSSRRSGTETNQFVPFPTGLRGYEEHGIWRGDATQARADQLHRARCMSGASEAEKRGWTVIEGLATFAAPSGTTVRLGL